MYSMVSLCNPTLILVRMFCTVGLIELLGYEGNIIVETD